MGIEWHTARFLIGAHESGVDFTQTATLGRQNLYVSKDEIRNFVSEYGTLRGDLSLDSSEYADSLFKLLGAKEYVPIDASSYEGASEVHDMNHPIPDRLRNAFDVVVDGGTLEHVFNFPTAIRNCMEMVRVGGRLFLQTPANNYFGHGFYQFSPELYYRVLSPSNGFAIERMIAYEAYPYSQWYEVSDPAQIGARVELISCCQRVLLLIQAIRTHEKAVLANPPQQSDYAATWTGSYARNCSQNGKFGIRQQPGVLRRLAWSGLRLFGIPGKKAAHQRRSRYFNRQLSINAQPDVFRAISK